MNCSQLIIHSKFYVLADKHYIGEFILETSNDMLLLQVRDSRRAGEDTEHIAITAYSCR